MDTTLTGQELATPACKSDFDPNMIHVTSVMQKNVRAYRILHTEQNDVWVYNKDKTLKLYDEQLVKKKTLRLTFNLCDLALTSSQDIIATDYYDNKRVVKISQSGSVSILCNTAPLYPQGICINSRQQVVVGLQADDDAPPIKLSIYSSDGSTVLQEIENDEGGEPLFREEISQVKQNRKGDYVVADCDRIVCVSCEGRFRWEYIVGFVVGMVCDKYDNVIIAEYDTNKISLLSSEGKLVTTLLTGEDGISRPESLSIDRHGLLWIGQENRLKVVKYLK